MTDETINNGEPNPGVPVSTGVDLAAVPAHIIPATLPHPNISSPLARGVQYLHHFEILLVSDGRRLWDAASDEGKQVLSDIKGENAAHADTIAAAKAAPALDPAGAVVSTGTDADGQPNPPAAKPTA